MKVSRRDFVKSIGVAAVAAPAAAVASLALPAGGEAAGPQPTPRDERPAPLGGRRPNFLIILCDQMRFPTVYETQTLKDFRARYLTTQNLLRENGVEFTNHYVASSACSPSRTCILTGHYPSLHAVSQTYGGAKEACDPEVFWLDPNSVPTFGNYFRAAGYRTYWKGKWHVSDADMLVPGTHTPLLSFDPQTGARDPDQEALYVAADRLGPYGFAGWIGPEAHGPNPLRDTGSSAKTANHGRDAGFAEQTVELLQQLDREHSEQPWLVVSSFVNPHDICVFCEESLASGAYDFHVDDDVPADDQLFVPDYDASRLEDLKTKPKAQQSYAENYGVWGGEIPDDLGPHYRRFYYQLHKNLDEQMANVMRALLASRFKDDTIVVFASDHGDMLGAHGDLHQKFYQAYDETVRVPLIVWSRKLFKKPRTIEEPTSHIDLAPTLLGLAGIDPEPIRKQLARNHSDARRMVGRDLSSLLLGEVDPPSVSEPVYIMIEDDPYKGPHMGDAQGISKPTMVDPKCIEAVVARLDGALWKYTRYFDSKQYWTDPPESSNDPGEDVFLKQIAPTPDAPYDGAIDCNIVVKGVPAAEEYELYDLSSDPLELTNLYGKPAHAAQQAQMEDLLKQQRDKKRLTPISGTVPGQ